MNAETIIEAVCVSVFLLIPIYMARPFTWESAQLEARREREAGNESATVTRRWCGWVVVHSANAKDLARQKPASLAKRRKRNSSFLRTVNYADPRVRITTK
jgi:hypothetical protein